MPNIDIERAMAFTFGRELHGEPQVALEIECYARATNLCGHKRSSFGGDVF